MKNSKKVLDSSVVLGINLVLSVSGLFCYRYDVQKQGVQYVLLAIALAGISATLIAMHYAVMSSRIDEDGGYVGVRKHA